MGGGQKPKFSWKILEKLTDESKRQFVHIF